MEGDSASVTVVKKKEEKGTYRRAGKACADGCACVDVRVWLVARRHTEGEDKGMEGGSIGVGQIKTKRKREKRTTVGRATHVGERIHRQACEDRHACE